jgi:hypothetical protein
MLFHICSTIAKAIQMGLPSAWLLVLFESLNPHLEGYMTTDLTSDAEPF